MPARSAGEVGALCALFDPFVPETHMTSRVTTKTVKFVRAFRLDEIERELPAGEYRVEMEEETLDNVSFVAYRRIATHIFLPATGGSGSAEMCAIHPEGLTRALTLDRALEAPV